MTAEIPTPQIPQSLHAAMAEWGRHHGAVGEIDARLKELDGVVEDLRRKLTEASTLHADLGRQRTTAESEAEFARGMVEHGCQRLGIEMPAEPFAPAPQALMSMPLPSGVEPVSGQQAVQALTDLSPSGPLETVSDPGPAEVVPQNPAGGDQSGEPGFQPEPAEADSRRRRGARRG